MPQENTKNAKKNSFFDVMTGLGNIVSGWDKRIYWMLGLMFTMKIMKDMKKRKSCSSDRMIGLTGLRSLV